MKSISDQIQLALQQNRELEKVAQHLSALQLRMDQAIAQKNELVKLVNKEEEDVSKLESLSLKGLFYKVLGSKEEQLEKERQEYLQAFMQLQAHNKEIELLEFEQGVMNEKRTNHAGVKERLEKLMKLREKELVRSGSGKGQRILKIEKEKEQAGLINWEIDEALQVGNAANKLLLEMIHYLKGARQWGQWRQSNNTRWQQYQRRSYIDQARERGYHAKQALIKFQQELRDLYPNPTNYAKALQLDLYQGFLANLFNNLLHDWVLQQKIKNSLNLVINVKDQVTMELAQLDRERHKQKDRIKLLENEKNNILLSK